MRGWPVLLALSFLSGCTGPAQEPLPSGVTTATTTTLPVEASAPPPVLMPVEHPVAWDGRFGTAACLPRPPNVASCYSTAVSPSETSHRVEAPGAAAWSGNLTLAWDASSPVMAELRVEVWALDSCGDGCLAGSLLLGAAQGPSPLLVEVAGTVGNATAELGVSVDRPLQSAYPTAGVTLDQPFRVSGTLIAMPQ